MEIKSSPNVDRRTASKLLGVSMRTIDRYIRRGRLSAEQRNGRIWLRKKEILNFPREKIYQINNERDTTTLSAAPKNNIDPTFYHDLYEEAKHAIGEYQQKLEIANYRIGQLESRSFHQIPQQNIENKDNGFTTELLRREISDLEKENNLLRDLAKKEKTDRIVFSVLTYVLLIMLPLFWYLIKGI